MKDIVLITNNIDVKEAFGSFAILDEVEVFDHPRIYQFARIISNYKKMKRIEKG